MHKVRRPQPSGTNGNTLYLHSGTHIFAIAGYYERFRDLPGNIIGLGGPRLLRYDVPGALFPATGEISIDPALASSEVYSTAVSIHRHLRTCVMCNPHPRRALTLSGRSL